MNEEWMKTLEVVRTADHADEVLKLLRSVDELAEDARWRVLSASLERLEELQYNGLEEELLLQCIVRSGYEGHFIHGFLNRWLKQQSAAKFSEVMFWLIARLNDDNLLTVENSLWTLITIGSRTKQLEEIFVTLINEPPTEKIQLVALWGLIWMGFPGTKFLETTVERLLNQQAEVPELLARCGRVMASLNLLPIYLQHFNRVPITAEMPMFSLDSFTNLLYVFADTAEVQPHSSAQIWDDISIRAQDLVSFLSFHGGILDKIDDVRVPDYILHSLSPVPPEEYREGNYISPHLHPYLMLKTLNSKKQLAGLHSSLERASPTTKEHILEALYLDATVDTKNIGAYQTGLSHVKETCWDVLLRLNLSETPKWIIEALEEETGPFAAADLCHLAGYFRVTGAIENLRNLAVQEGWDQKEGLNIVLGLAVIEALGYIGTFEAFNALTKSRVSYVGRYAAGSFGDTTPRNYGDAFTACLTSDDAVRNAEALILELEKGPVEHPRCWIACAAALQDAVRYKPELVKPYHQRVYALLDRYAVLQPEFLQFLVSAVGYLPNNNELEPLLLDWARSDELQAMNAIEALARWQCLHPHIDLLTKIGLNQSQDRVWHVSRAMNYREAFVVGLLFNADQETFTPALCDLIKKGSYREAVQVLQLLTNENTSSAIMGALIERVHEVNQPFRSEGEVLEALLRIDPYRFAHEFRYDITSSWHAASRKAIVYYGEDLDASVGTDIMVAFLNDPVYVIRRAAARDLAKKDMSRLQDAIQLLSTAAEPEGRIRSVEAAVWFDSQDLFNIYCRQAKQDIEEKVRSAAREAENDRRRVEAARDYLSHILEVPSDKLLATWHYGQALQEVGDDETIQRLDEAIAQPDLASNKRAYLKKLRDEITKEWEKWEKKRQDRLLE